MTQRFLLILLLLGIFRISSAQIGSIDIDDQSQNRALLETKIYQLPDFEKIDFAETQLIEENFQIPAFHIYNELWDTVHIRSTSIVIPFYQNSLKIRLLENNNNPFAFPCSGSMILDYGLLKKEFHSGIDFLETDGSPIVSCFDGVVRLARYYRDYGKVVVIRHYNGLETVYAHLKEISVVPGQIVKAGDLIGNAGNTGNAIDPTLHFEIRLFNELINPNKVIDFVNRKLMENLIELTLTDFNITPLIASDSIQLNPVKVYEPLPEKSKEAPQFHIVKSGDTLNKIARLYNTTTDALIKLNNLKGDGSNLQLDQKIRIK
ncbi:MAG TPA: peptidoglycan DD-metalloendopeptidase family protein [Bacteroidales bacterium]|jgi:murein DD-endopeptidase MepM/ murein hydrolase activator NlpD|nr:peptidoglycan DD-metalloendopeptidase family protein [Bacteroidales bacterium]